MTVSRRLLLTLPALSWLPASAQTAAATLDPRLRKRAERAVAGGLHYLRGQQAPDGSLMGSVGVTALMLRAFLESPEAYTRTTARSSPGRWSTSWPRRGPTGRSAPSCRARPTTPRWPSTRWRPPRTASTTTSSPRAASSSSATRPTRTRATSPTIPSTAASATAAASVPICPTSTSSLEGLKAGATDPKDPVWQKALAFVSRSQNRSESNDQKWAGNDGGFAYRPGANPPEYENGTASYGGMTAAGLLSLLFAGADKNDPRVQAAYKWMTRNYTLEFNPGTTKKHGLFYFYNAFAKVMRPTARRASPTARARQRNWRNELVNKLLSCRPPTAAGPTPNPTPGGKTARSSSPSWAVIALEHTLK
jgi:squalene-hopene/tetraprenyl-beta-curcumene cyclase